MRIPLWLFNIELIFISTIYVIILANYPPEATRIVFKEKIMLDFFASAVFNIWLLISLLVKFLSIFGRGKFLGLISVILFFAFFFLKVLDSRLYESNDYNLSFFHLLFLPLLIIWVFVDLMYFVGAKEIDLRFDTSKP